MMRKFPLALLVFSLFLVPVAGQAGDTIFDATDQNRSPNVTSIRVAAGSEIGAFDPNGDEARFTLNSDATASGAIFGFIPPSSGVTFSVGTIERVNPSDGTWTIDYSLSSLSGASSLEFNIPASSPDANEPKRLTLTFGSGSGSFSGTFTWNIHLAPTTQTLDATGGPPTASDGSQYDPANSRTFVDAGAPTGVRVTEADTGNGVEFVISNEDPDQTAQGTYEIQRDTGTGFSTLTTTTAGGGQGGIVGYLDTTGSPGDEYRVRLSYEITAGAGPYLSAFSCETATSCGDFGSGGGSMFGNDGILYGQDKSGLANSMQLTTDALDALYGLLFIFLFGLVGFKSAGNVGGGIGAAGGFVWNLAFGLWPFWYVLFVVVGAAAFIRVRQRGGGMDA